MLTIEQSHRDRVIWHTASNKEDLLNSMFSFQIPESASQSTCFVSWYRFKAEMVPRKKEKEKKKKTVASAYKPFTRSMNLACSIKILHRTAAADDGRNFSFIHGGPRQPDSQAATGFG